MSITDLDLRPCPVCSQLFCDQGEECPTRQRWLDAQLEDEARFYDDWPALNS